MTSLAPATAMDRARAALLQLRERPGVVGAVLATRDGIALLHEGGSFGNLESFAAMQATALGAAEIALHSMAESRSIGLVIDVGARRVVARGITPDLILVLMIDASCSWEQAFAWMAATADALG